MARFEFKGKLLPEKAERNPGHSTAVMALPGGNIDPAVQLIVDIDEEGKAPAKKLLQYKISFPFERGQVRNLPLEALDGLKLDRLGNVKATGVLKIYFEIQGCIGQDLSRIHERISDEARAPQKHLHSMTSKSVNPDHDFIEDKKPYRPNWEPISIHINIHKFPKKSNDIVLVARRLEYASRVDRALLCYLPNSI